MDTSLEHGNPYLHSVTGEDVREAAWTLVDILQLTQPAQARTWDSTLRGLEDEYVSREVWLECVTTLRGLVNGPSVPDYDPRIDHPERYTDGRPI